MKSRNGRSSDGTSFSVALSVMVVWCMVNTILKLTGTSTMGWLWVFAPLWVPMVATMILVILIIIAVAIYASMTGGKNG